MDVADLGKSNDVEDRTSGKSLAASRNCTACYRWMIRLPPGSTISFYVVAANAGGDAALSPTVTKVVGA